MPPGATLVTDAETATVGLTGVLGPVCTGLVLEGETDGEDDGRGEARWWWPLSGPGEAVGLTVLLAGGADGAAGLDGPAGPVVAAGAVDAAGSDVVGVDGVAG
jgi:hypothetical protein